MEKSPSIVNIAKALKQFHAEIGKIPKDAMNPFFNSRYATLSGILAAIKEPLQNAGLTFTQFPSAENGLFTILMHPDSGEYMQSEFFIKPVKNDPQALGSVISYMRRYALAAVLGLNLEEDSKAPMPVSKADKPTDEKKWLDMDTPEWRDALESLRDGTQTIKDLYNAFKISKQNRAELEAAMQAPEQPTTADNRPWLDKGKKYDLVAERLKNRTTTLAEVKKYFKLNKEITAELQSIIDGTNNQK